MLVNSIIVEHDPQHRPAFWGRLRDDINMAWVGTVEQLLEFMAWLNSIPKTLYLPMTTLRLVLNF